MATRAVQEGTPLGRGTLILDSQSFYRPRQVFPCILLVLPSCLQALLLGAFCKRSFGEEVCCRWVDQGWWRSKEKSKVANLAIGFIFFGTHWARCHLRWVLSKSRPTETGINLWHMWVYFLFAWRNWLIVVRYACLVNSGYSFG